jgi:AcrR family transcriptional regulator
MAPLHDLLTQRIEEIKAMPADPQGEAQLETVRRFMRTLLATFSESGDAIGLILMGDRREATAFYRRHVRPLIDAAIEASAATMETWPHRDYDLRVAMKATFGMAFWLALDGMLDRPISDRDAVADQLADLLFNGIKAR